MTFFDWFKSMSKILLLLLLFLSLVKFSIFGIRVVVSMGSVEINNRSSSFEFETDSIVVIELVKATVDEVDVVDGDVSIESLLSSKIIINYKYNKDLFSYFIYVHL